MPAIGLPLCRKRGGADKGNLMAEFFEGILPDEKISGSPNQKQKIEKSRRGREGENAFALFELQAFVACLTGGEVESVFPEIGWRCLSIRI
jgi:hypothetical protein